MPSIKVKSKAVEQKSGFEPYDGPEPSRRGMYRARVKKMQYQKNSSGSYGFFIVAELEAQSGDPKGHSKFDGYPMFSRGIIVSSADGSALKEGAQRNLDNLMSAFGTKADPDVIVAKGDVEQGALDVLKVGGKNPVDFVVNIDLNFEQAPDGGQRPNVGGIYRFKELDAEASSGGDEDEDESEEDDESDLMEGGDEEASEVDERAAELDEMSVVALRKLAKELGEKSSGTKDEVIERILDAEFPEDADENEESEEADDEEEADEDEAEESDEDEEEADEDDESAARREELEGFDRAALKKIVKGHSPEFKVFPRHTEADLIEAILDIEFGEDTPF